MVDSWGFQVMSRDDWTCKGCGNWYRPDNPSYECDMRCTVCGYIKDSLLWNCSLDCAEAQKIEHQKNCTKCKGEMRVTCDSCGGDGSITVTDPCVTHAISHSHYYCTAHNNKNCGQYH